MPPSAFTCRALCALVLTTVLADAMNTIPQPPARTVPPISDRARIGTLDVPHVGLGTIKWSPDNAADTVRLKSTFHTAMDDGLIFFDSAERYGASTRSLLSGALRAFGLGDDSKGFGGSGEELLGGFAAEHTAASAEGLPKAIIATKFTPVPWRRDAQSVVDACAASARRLGVDSVDLYQIHMPDIVQPFRSFGAAHAKDPMYWDGLAECVRLGLAKNVGVSNYGPTLLTRAHDHLERLGVQLASNQICYSLLNRRQGGQATVDRCRELGVTPLAYYPLAMGVLAGKWGPGALPEDAGLRAYLTGDERRGIPPGGATPVIDQLRAIGAARERTPAQVALNWVICRGVVPIVGASRPEHIGANAGALGWRLDPSELEQLEAAADACGFEFAGSGFKTTDSKFVGYGFEKWRLD